MRPEGLLRWVPASGNSWRSHFAEEKTEAHGSKASFPKSGGPGARPCFPQPGQPGRMAREEGPGSGTPLLSPRLGEGGSLLGQPVMGSPAGPPSSTDPGEPSPTRPGSLMRNLLALERTQHEKRCSLLPAGWLALPGERAEQAGPRKAAGILNARQGGWENEELRQRREDRGESRRVEQRLSGARPTPPHTPEPPISSVLTTSSSPRWSCSPALPRLSPPEGAHEHKSGPPPPALALRTPSSLVEKPKSAPAPP